MSALLDGAVADATTVARAALADSPLVALLGNAIGPARHALNEETTETWRILPPSDVIGFVRVDTSRQSAHSVKVQNVAVRPMLALRNALGGATTLATLATGGALTNLLATGAVSVAGGLISLPLSALSFVMAAHFARRQEIGYDHGCILAIAWSVSEYMDGNYIAAKEDLYAALPSMADFGIFDYNVAKAMTAISRLQAWQALRIRPTDLVLHERIKVRRG